MRGGCGCFAWWTDLSPHSNYKKTMRFVFCPVCSKENDAKSLICKACGRNIQPSKIDNKIIDLHPSQIREIIEDKSSANQKEPSAAGEELVGVKGVLTFLCVILIVFIPVMWIGSLREILLTGYGDAANFPSVRDVLNNSVSRVLRD